jgi:molybdopterin-guanine dinucleotide biosynthesis protein B
VEGFKYAPIPKLEVWRAETGEPLLHPNDVHFVAVATDAKIESRLPVLDLNNVDAIASFVVSHLKLA